MTTTIHKTTSEAGAYITRAGLHWGSAIGAAAGPITYGFRLSAPSYDSSLHHEQSTFFQFTPPEMAAAYSVMRLWSNVANITFAPVGNPYELTNNATILFGNYSSMSDGSGAFAYFPGNVAPGSADGDVWINADNNDEYSLPPGSYAFETMLHEVGHALGLQHPGNYNAAPGASITYSQNAEYVEDTRQYSVMSYFSSSNTGAQHFGIEPSTPLLHDIAAIQRLYGANMSFATGDTIYGYGSNADFAYHIESASDWLVCCVWDAGGVDTFNFSGYFGGQTINLNQNAFSDVNGLTKNWSIAQGAVIENATGGTGSDQIIGNGVANVLDGGAGDDSIFGFVGNDTLSGNSGVDLLNGGDGDDKLDGGAGGDSMTGGSGSDGYWVDNVADSVFEAPSVDFDSDIVHSTISYTLQDNVEWLELLGAAPIYGVGNGQGNVIWGNAAANTLRGLDGDDDLFGGDGSDTLYGGAGIDYLLGEIGNDLIYGEMGNDGLVGFAGNDLLDGGAGVDTMGGGPGNDTYIVDSAGDGVSELPNEGVDLVRTTLSSFVLGQSVENLTYIGSAAFVGTGNSASNIVVGGSGNDTLYGLGGNDTLTGGAGVDTMIGGVGNDTYAVDILGDKVTEEVSSGTDTVKSAISYTLGANLENLTLQGSGAINGTGNTLNNAIQGNAGNNALNGLGGVDTVSYVNATAGVKVNLALAGAQNTVGAGTDTLSQFENLTGSSFADTLTGNASANVISGGAGNDRLVAGAGNDRLTGGTGLDKFVFDAPLSATTNVDSVTDFTAGQDTFVIDKTIFTAVSVVNLPLDPTQFFAAAGATAGADASDRIVYNSTTGDLYYDVDGVGGSAATLFVKLTTHPAITATSVFVEA